VAISLVTTLVFMPGVILGTYRWIEKTKHRRLIPSFERFGKLVCRVTMPMVIVFVILVVPSFIGSINNEFWYGGSHIYGPDTRVGADEIKLNEVFGDSDTYVLMVPRGEKSREYALVRELEADKRVTSVLSSASVVGPALPGEILPDALTDQFHSEKYERMVMSVAVPMESEETFRLIEDIQKTCEKYYPGEYHLTGTGVCYYDLKTVVTGDRLKVNLIAILAVFVVLLFTMQNLLLPAILVMTTETAIWINLSMSYVTGSPLYFISYLIISSVQLGATVDYAILFTQRYRENRNVNGLGPRESVIKTLTDNTAAILTSATAVSVMGFLMWVFSSQGMVSQEGLLLGRGTLCSLFAVLFVLPGLLMTFDRIVIRSFSFSSLFRKKEAEGDNAA
jgi:predicted RND superfamily exporter protein